MADVQAQVREFHEKFGVECALYPSFPDQKTCQLREDLIEEEFIELSDAINNRDIVKVADALGDILYVVYGAALAFGIDMGPVSDEVHRSNMTKVWPDGTVRRRHDGKILKPPTYSPADIEAVLERQG